MTQTIEKTERIKCIEKNILSFIFTKDKFKEDEYTNKIHYKISDSLKDDLGNYVPNDEIDKVLSDLIDKKYIDRYTDNTLHLCPQGLEYALNSNYITPKDIINYCDTLNTRQLDCVLAISKYLKTLENESNKQKEIVDKKILNINDKISNFYNNIISIMALLIAAFSIIGFNIGGIKFIVSNTEILPIWKYVLGILVINVSIVISLFAIFYLLQKIINPDKSLFKFRKISKKEIPENKVRLSYSSVFQLLLIICNIFLIIKLFIIK